MSDPIDTLMMQPYARVFVVHLTILGGGFAARQLQATPAPEPF